MSGYLNRALLLCFATAAVLALVGLVALGGIAGFGFGFSLLIVGGVGAPVLGDVLDDLSADQGGQS